MQELVKTLHQHLVPPGIFVVYDIIRLHSANSVMSAQVDLS